MVTVYNSCPRDKTPPALCCWGGGLKEQGPLMSTNLLPKPVKASQPHRKQTRLSPSQVLFALETHRRWSEQQSQSATCVHAFSAARFGPRWARFLLNLSVPKASASLWMIKMVHWKTAAAAVTRQHANQLNEILYNILLTKAERCLLFLRAWPLPAVKAAMETDVQASIWTADGSAFKPGLLCFSSRSFTDVAHDSIQWQ